LRNFCQFWQGVKDTEALAIGFLISLEGFKLTFVHIFPTETNTNPGGNNMRLTITWIYIALLIMSVFIFTWMLYASILYALQDPWPVEAIAGKRVWQQKGCIECHALLGNGSYSAVDLTKITLELSQKDLENFLTNPPIIRSAKKRRHLTLTKEEAENIYKYLEQVGTIDTANWPPQPRSSHVN